MNVLVDEIERIVLLTREQFMAGMVGHHSYTSPRLT